MPNLRADRFSTYKATFDSPDGVFERRVWTYESADVLYDVTVASSGLRYRVNMGVWHDTPTSGIHDEIVRFYRIDADDQSGERRC